MKRILITGANSYVGTNVERWLMREPEKFQVDTLDMIHDSWRKKDFSGYDVVYHVAGIAHVSAKKALESLYYKVNTDLVIETAKHAKQCNVRQFIFMSSMIVYGENKSLKPVVITKDTEPKPNGFYGNSKLQAEIGIKKLEDEHFKVVILRPPMIYGSESKGNFQKLIALVKITPFFPEFHNQRSMIYIKNLCEFIKLVIEKERYGVFWPQNAEYTDITELVRLIGHVYGKNILSLKGFSWALKILSHFCHGVNKAFGSLYYEQQLSNYVGHYQLYTLNQSIKEIIN